MHWAVRLANYCSGRPSRTSLCGRSNVFAFLLFPTNIEVSFELLKSTVMPTVVEKASMNLFSAMSLFSVELFIFCVRAARQSTVVPHVSLVFSCNSFRVSVLGTLGNTHV